MKSNSFRLHSRGFTLVELLTVISIIAILMGILIPTINSAIEAAKKAQAKTEMSSLVTAIKAYYTEYGKYPYDSTVAAPTADPLPTAPLKETTLAPILTELRAKNAAATSINPRKIQFLEVPDAKNWGVAGKERGGMAKATANGTAAAPVWVDPWGNSYRVMIDYDYDNSLTNPYTANAGNTTVSTGVIVWSIGRDANTNVADKNLTFSKDDVISWQ